jgi:hypothetical protein
MPRLGCPRSQQCGTILGTQLVRYAFPNLAKIAASSRLGPFRVVDHRTLDREDALVSIGDDQKERGNFLLSHATANLCDKGYYHILCENEAVLDRMATRLKARPEILDRRRETVEHPFGSIKQWMNQGAFLMKGLENVRAEFSLTALVYNLRRALNILGAEAMMAAVRA